MRSGKGELAKTVLNGILLTGMIVVASSSPAFASKILPEILKHAVRRVRSNYLGAHDLDSKKINNRKFYNAFYNLKKRGMIQMAYRGKQVYISLTETGKKMVQKYQIDDLAIRKSARWNGQWYGVIFDIEEQHKSKREALRGKLKELGLYQLQESVWVSPYPCEKEMSILSTFFGLTSNEMRMLLVSRIDDDRTIRKYFKLPINR